MLQSGMKVGGFRPLLILAGIITKQHSSGLYMVQFPKLRLTGVGELVSGKTSQNYNWRP